LLNVLKINPNAVVVMDKDEGLLSPKAPSKYKAKLRRELLEHDQLVWVTEPKCIELYIPATADADEGLQATFSECRDIENTRNKVNRAQSYMMKTEQHSRKDIVDLSTDIESQLKNVFERICCWAGHSKSISSA
ncbi:MAG TPA: hypothetical protein VMT78_07410, partial [Terriglobia bacterium]|nr:hypothetical protein [Terriglobia bacterium]